MDTRKVFFKTRSEKVLISGVIIAMFAVYLFEFFIILPKLYGPGFESSHKLIHIVAGTWIMVNALFAMWKFISIDPGAGSVVLPSALKEGWRFCWRCEANFPPRSYHCYSCDRCVLVRDHHCVIGSNCVGYKNRRYFLQMNFYMWFALLYANFLNMDFVFELYHSFSSQSLLTMFMPLLAWMFGIAKSETFFMAMATSFCVVSFLYGTAVLSFHLRNTLKGRTTPEVTKGTGLTYDLGTSENLANAFGVNWKFAWVSPFVPSPLPGDGFHFRERELLPQNGKSM